MPGGIGAFTRNDDPIIAIKEEVHYDLGVNFLIEKFFTYSYNAKALSEAKITLYFLGSIDNLFSANKDSASTWKYFSKDEIEEIKDSIAFGNYNVIKEFFSKA